jgi:hypothetical protein
MGTRFRWPRTGRDQYWDIVNTAMNLQIRETTRNLWHNRVQSAQECYLLLQFNVNIMIHPPFKVKRRFCVSESCSPRFGTGFWYTDVNSRLPNESFSECWHKISASLLFHDTHQNSALRPSAWPVKFAMLQAHSMLLYVRCSWQKSNPWFVVFRAGWKVPRFLIQGPLNRKPHVWNDQLSARFCRIPVQGVTRITNYSPRAKASHQVLHRLGQESTVIFVGQMGNHARKVSAVRKQIRDY